jgi:hypothetical protein
VHSLGFRTARRAFAETQQHCTSALVVYQSRIASTSGSTRVYEHTFCRSSTRRQQPAVGVLARDPDIIRVLECEDGGKIMGQIEERVAMSLS